MNHEGYISHTALWLLLRDHANYRLRCWCFAASCQNSQEEVNRMEKIVAEASRE